LRRELIAIAFETAALRSPWLGHLTDAEIEEAVDYAMGVGQ
jgi:hypothetical protein